MTLHQCNDLIAQRYRIIDALGQGGMGITYEAEDLSNHQRVAIKAVSLKQAQEWKVLELFEREAKVIAHLHHPQLPQYLDFFHVDTQSDRIFYLIRELVAGDSLEDVIQNGKHFTEEEIRDITVQILKILVYLHNFTPPIIHRDIKPQNIIYQPDGQVFLVDFGAVQEVYRQTISSGQTFVGTIGYMPPEQLTGKAYFASDLYSLGATVLYLLTHHSPDRLPQKRMKIDFHSSVNISSTLADWLDRVLEPMFEDRFESATEALKVLENQTHIDIRKDIADVYKYPKPKKSNITLHKTSRLLVMNIPPRGFRSEDGFIWIFALFWNGSMLLGILAHGLSLIFSFAILHILVGLGFILYLSWSSGVRTYMRIDQDNFLLQWKVLFFQRKIQGKISDLEQICVHDTQTKVNGRPLLNCALFEGVKKHQFGSFISLREKEWLVAEISEWLEENRRSPET
ncbi:serine/threonine-protein kinase [Roseofilum sp. Guam]|uniref:serine/threonine protein kinase n=1 Tax=Roseofilum sp. Guam TaxID=2821502 RepID=UPI001B1452A3|nr:serine/threonine-protein kinase [Roseofilum sp. Guam]MBP0030268.1 protein kinase [Roseofilum sp. Guam]